MENYLTGARGGERKSRNTNTNTPGRSGQTLKGQEKRKAEADRNRAKPATEALEPTYRGET